VNFLGDLGSTILGAAYAYRIQLALGAIVAVVAIAVVARRRG
jgi:hypothetical protein